MVNFHELREADPTVYSRQADKWRNITQRAEERGSDVQRHLDALADWTGPASENAKLEMGVLRKSLHDMTTELAKVPPVLESLHDTIARIQRRIADVVDRAVTRGFKFHTIEADGRVGNPLAPLPAGQGDARELAKQLTITFQDLLRQANEADTTAANALSKLTAGATGFAPSSDFDEAIWSSTTIPARGTPAEDVQKWWNCLSIQQREALLFNKADVIGSLDGIPALVRDRANRSQLPGLTEQTREQIATLEARPSRTPGEEDQLAKLRDKLVGLEGMLDRLNKVDGSHPQAFLLKIGTDGTGRAIVAIGNPDTATNVSTFVPGTGTRVGHAPWEVARADNMMLAALSNNPDGSTSVVAWMDYEAPQEIFPDAADSGYAEKASGELRNFEHGLRVTHEGAQSHNTLVGHSYGGEVAGFAARGGAVDADALVFVATPDTGVAHPDGLHLTGVAPEQMNQRIYHTVGDADLMRALEYTNPRAPDFPGRIDPGGHAPPQPPFGGIAFGSDPGTDHGGYWNIDQQGHMNKSLDGMGKIIAGRQPVS